eukprot:199607-Pleurochrysis_carterae.AAC.2
MLALSRNFVEWTDRGSDTHRSRRGQYPDSMCRGRAADVHRYYQNRSKDDELWLSAIDYRVQATSHENWVYALYTTCQRSRARAAT